MPRGLVALPLIGLYIAVLGPLCILAALVDRSGAATHRLLTLWARLSLWTGGVSAAARGVEHVPAGACVFAANHVSALDIPVLYAALPAEFRFVHKRSLFLVPVVGQVLLLGGHVGIDRGRAFRARRSLAEAARRIRGGLSVLVFPEGTRSRDGRVQPFKRGSFRLAIEAGVPVVPVSLIGVERSMPGSLLSLRAGRVEVVVHAPLPTRERRPEDAEALASEVERVVREGLGRD